jgi:ABC-type glycerol-3-phosphate transport system substrate-binding protein
MKATLTFLALLAAGAACTACGPQGTEAVTPVLTVTASPSSAGVLTFTAEPDGSYQFEEDNDTAGLEFDAYPHGNILTLTFATAGCLTAVAYLDGVPSNAVHACGSPAKEKESP